MKIFLYSSFVYSCNLFLISSASVRCITFLSIIGPIFTWNVSLVSNFLEEISRLSYSIIFLYFFALITEGAFLISPCYSLEPCLQMGIYFLFSFAFCFSSFQSYLYGLLRHPFCFPHFFFLGMVLIPVSCTISQISIHSSFQSQRKAVPKNAQTTTQLHSSHTLVK